MNSAMSSLELDQDAFYICTETSPRCFVVQKAIQIDRSQIERMMDLDKEAAATTSDAPPAPQLPYWFTPECRSELVNCDPPRGGIPYAPSPSPIPPPVDLKAQLKAQLEYYFSRENLATDRYLRCQMDADQYVSISIIAGFRKIVQLTNDYNLILQVLKESSVVEVDDRGERVRPVCRRCTIILREVQEDQADEVEEMLSGGPHFLSLKYGLNCSWYVTYPNEETTQRAYLHLQNSGAQINGKPVCARIKTGGPPMAELPIPSAEPSRAPSTQALSEPPRATTPSAITPPDPPLSHLFDLGHVLASYGYVPRATYRPGATVVHVEEEISPRESHRHSTRVNGANGRHADSQTLRQSEGGRRGGRGGYFQNSQGSSSHQQQQTTFYSSNNSYSHQNGFLSGENGFRRGGLRTENRGPRGRPRAYTTGTFNDKRPFDKREGRRREFYNSQLHQNGHFQSNSLHQVESPPELVPPPLLAPPTPYNGGGNLNPGPTLQIHHPSISPEPDMLIENDKEDKLGEMIERQHLDSEPSQSSEGPSSHSHSCNASTTTNSDSLPPPLPVRKERTKRWADAVDNENSARGLQERKSSESGRSGVSNVSVYSFEEQSFPSLCEKKPEKPKPEPKPTFSSVAAGRRREKPEPKKSYAQTLRAPPIHN